MKVPAAVTVGTHRGSPSSRVWVVLLAVSIGLALVPRGLWLDKPVLSGDEAFSWRLTQYPASEVIQRTAADVHPPLYYLLLKAWVAVWGDSPIALRGLSLLFGVLCVPMIYALCREAGQLRSEEKDRSAPWLQGGALLAAALLALHATQLPPSRTVRMYAVGTFLAGLSAWLLLRALRSPGRKLEWWSTYGITVAAFCYTHYYAFFTVAAQAVFVACLMARQWWKTSFCRAAGTAAWFLFAVAIAFLLYAPWLHVLEAQVHQVRQNYWIPPITAQAAESQFFSWATGVLYQDKWESCLLLLLLGASILVTVWRKEWVGCFFLLQAVLPWVLSLGISVLSGRTIYFERYMVFAHFFFLGYVAAIYWSLPGWEERTLIACALVGCCLCGLWETVMRYPKEPSGLADAVEFIKSEHRPGDVILTDSAYSLNRIRYYAAQQGMASMIVKCRKSWSPGEGHFTHIASIRADDVWRGEPSTESGPPGRIWWAVESGAIDFMPKEGLDIAMQRTFEGGGTRFTLILYDRPAK